MERIKKIHFVKWYHSSVKQEQGHHQKNVCETWEEKNPTFFNPSGRCFEYLPLFLYSSVTTYFLVDLVEIFWMLSNLFWSLWLEVKARCVKNCSRLRNERIFWYFHLHFFKLRSQFSRTVSTLWSFFNSISCIF